jgi:hypothetical protein
MSLFVSNLSTYAQDRCVVTHNVVSDALGTYFTCIEPDSLDGKSILVPANTTRLDRKALTLCPQEFENSMRPNPAIVFVVDQSGSMASAGDPQSVRDDAVRQAIAYQANTNPGSWAGYVEFGGTSYAELESHYFPLIPLWPEQVPLIQSVIEAKGMGGTNYIPALIRANNLFNDLPPDAEVSSRAIIFITDGEPSENIQVVLDSLAAQPGVFPPVFGVFMGNGSPGAALTEITNWTSGEYHQIDPTRPDDIIDLIESVVRNILTTGEPSGMRVHFGNAQVSEAADFLAQVDGAWNMTLEQDIPLVPGVNDLNLEMDLNVSSGGQLSRSVHFQIIVGADSSSISGQGAEPWVFESCGPVSHLSVTDERNSELEIIDFPYLTYPDSLFKIQLTTDFYEEVTTIAPTISLIRGSDQTFSLKEDSTGFYSSNLLSVSLAEVFRDSSIGVLGWDTVFITWQHPYDPRDFASTKFIVRQEPKFSMPQDTVLADAIEIVIEDPFKADYRLVDFFWEDGDWIGQDTVEWVGEGVYSEYLNLAEALSEKRYDRVIGRYTDSFTGDTYYDTVFVDFEIPVTPIAEMFDQDGNGVPDQMNLIFPNVQIPASQHLDSALIIWGRSGRDTLRVALDEGVTEVYFTDEFIFGETCSFRSHCMGRLILKGQFKGEPLSRTIDIIDKVGPVIISGWFYTVDDHTDVTLLRVKFSEKLVPSDEEGWLRYSKSSDDFSRMFPLNTSFANAVDSDSLEWDFFSDWEAPGALSVFDSLSLNPIYGFDLQNNPAHVENKPVEVSGDMLHGKKIEFSFKQSLYDAQSSLDNHPEEMQNAEPGSFGVSFLNVQQQQEVWKYLTQGSEIKTLGQQAVQSYSGPTLVIQVKVPQIGGFNSHGGQRGGVDPEGNPLWEIVLHTDIQVYDNIGQFVLHRSFKIPIDDPAYIDDHGNVNLFVEWLPDAQGGLKSENDKLLGAGAYIVKVNLTTSVTALDNIFSSRDGSAPEIVYVKGYLLKFRSEKMSIIGIRRSPME